MERSEPTLVPEWLRSTGSVTGGGNSNHHFPLSSSHSGTNILLLHAFINDALFLLTCLCSDFEHLLIVYPVL